MRKNVIQFTPKQPELFTIALELFINIADDQSDQHVIDCINDLKRADTGEGLYDFVTSILEFRKNQTAKNIGYAFAGIKAAIDTDPGLREIYDDIVFEGFGTLAQLYDAIALAGEEFEKERC